MRFIRQSSAVIVWLIIGVAGFMIYHQDTTLPLADVMSTQTPTIWGEMSYQIKSDSIIISNNSTILSGTLKFSISYDTSSLTLLTDTITSIYEYSYDTWRSGMVTVFVDGTVTPGIVITIPLQWDSSNMSIASPQLINGESTSSLSLTRIE